MTRCTARITLFLLLVVGAFQADGAAIEPAATGPTGIHWVRSEQAAFARARSGRRFVLLYLEAVWCHWCHVMDEKTYANPSVRAEIQAHFVALRIDQDLRPDLSQRYRNYGWPATVIFAANGREIAKRQGFIEAPRFLQLLKAVVKNPATVTIANGPNEPNATSGHMLDAQVRKELVRRYHATFDRKLGSLNTAQKFLDRDSVEYAIERALDGDPAAAARARKTLDAARALFDPAWGGVYQYSTFADWQHPHYEKLATVQAEYLRIYALAFAAFGRKQDALAVRSIRGYLDDFLRSPGGAFFVSQDADLHPGVHATGYFALDDKHRRARGIPRVDKHIYTLPNGEIIEALATWAELGADHDALREARRAARWIMANRSLPNGGFRHAEHDAAGPYLDDTLAMGRAFLALYRATARRVWLHRASAAADFIATHFARKPDGFLGAQSHGPIAAVPRISENISLARFANLLSHYTGKAGQRAMAESAMRYLADPNVALEEITEPGILLTDEELREEPLHLTVIGGKQDPAATRLFIVLQHLPQWYKRIEWWDRSEGALPNPDVNYPIPKRAAAFVCTRNRCSLPIYTASGISGFLKNSNKTTAIEINHSATPH